MKKNRYLRLMLFVASALLLESCLNKQDPIDVASLADNIGKNPLQIELSNENIRPAVIYEKGGVKVSALSLERTMIRTRVNVLVENTLRSGISLKAKLCSVNGVMISPLVRARCEGGEVANGSIDFIQSSLSEASITAINNIKLAITAISDIDGTELGGYAVSSLNTELSQSFVQEVDDSGEVVLDEGGIKIVVKKLVTGYKSKDLKIYAENNTDKGVSIRIRQASVSGIQTNPLLACDLTEGAKAFSSIRFSGPELMSVSNYTDILLGFHVVDLETKKTLLDTDPVAIFTGRPNEASLN